LEAAELERFEFSQPHMGTEFVIRLYAKTKDDAQQAAAAAFARIAELDGRLSDYQADSELSRLTRTAGSGQTVEVSEDLWNVLTAAAHAAEASDGAFDVTVGPFVRLWRRARRTGQMPSPERLEQAQEAVGYQHIELDRSMRRVRLKRPGMRLDLGGIAKGYAADEALRVLRQQGVTQALVGGGGDLAIGESPPGEVGWRVAIATLRRSEASDGTGNGEEGRDAESGREGLVLLLANCGVATSGDAYQFVEFDGKRYSHIVDPRTGLGVTTSSSATVVAPNCTVADALATAVSVLGPTKGIALIEQTAGAAALLVRIEEGSVRRYLSLRMEALLRQQEAVIELNGR
jgi:thiamine biosynthesis lipoprotein